MSEQPTPSAPNVTWEVTPEEDHVQWSRIEGLDYAPVNAWVAVDDTNAVDDSFDYPHPTRRETWTWAVDTEYGRTLAFGDARREADAKEDATKALLKALAEHQSYEG